MQEKLKEEFIKHFDKDGYIIDENSQPLYSYKEISDFWLSKIKEHYIAKEEVREIILKIRKEQDGNAKMKFSDGSEADIKLHSDMALGYNQALEDLLSSLSNN